MHCNARAPYALDARCSPLRLLPLEQDVLGPVEPRHLLLRLGRVAHLVRVVARVRVRVRARARARVRARVSASVPRLVWGVNVQPGAASPDPCCLVT